MIADRWTDEARERAAEAVLALRRDDPYAPSNEIVDAVLDAAGEPDAVEEGERRRWTLQAYSNRSEIEAGPLLGGRWLCAVEHSGEHFASCRFQGETVVVEEVP